MKWQDKIPDTKVLKKAGMQSMHTVLKLAQLRGTGHVIRMPDERLPKKGTSRQRSGNGAIRKRSPFQKPRWEKSKLTIRYLYHENIVRRMSSYFPNRWPLSYLNLTKHMKTCIRRQQHTNFKHQDIKQKEPPQKYRLGTISNTK